ncbi:alpha/beta hydrolase [Algiphilus sp.]|uniref:alpha/beta hydrolase n=1 Tax=Algiphilus sp. TaxID=1872431 RepID=UPI003C5B8A7A
MRRDIEFATSDGVTLRGWLITPEQGGGPFPCVVMAHGFSAVKELFLDRYAEIFAAAGLACVVYDHRNFGASDGAPRLEADPWLQVQGYRDAITFASLQPEIDRARIGVWGTSYSGGHVLPVAALDKRVKAVVSQVPFISGLQNMRRVFREEEVEGLRARFDADREARFQGGAPAMLPVFAEAGATCALPSPEEWAFIRDSGLLGTDMWLNEVTLRSAEMMMAYEPGQYIEQIMPAPLLMIVTTRDIVTPTDIALDAFKRAHAPKELMLVEGGHMEVYDAQFDRGSAAARDWLARHLGAG